MTKQKKNKQFILGILFCALLSSCSSISPNQAAIDVLSKSSVISWNSPQGVKRLEESKYKVDFFKLSNHFESQSNKIFCGPASTAIVLNALRVRDGVSELPVDSGLLSASDLTHLPKGDFSPYYKRYNQNNVLIEDVKKRSVILGERVGEKTDYGFQLRQLNELFLAHQTQCKLRIVDDNLPHKEIIQELIENLKTANDYIIINYKRSVLQQKGGGHISPLAAYHKSSDSFLIMDVTPNKADWVWVSSELLIQAMRTFDTVENRGYLLVK